VFVSSIPRPDRTYIHNALMAGTAGHPMFLALAKRARKRCLAEPTAPPEFISGPDVMMEVALSYSPVHWPMEAVCPIDWHTPRRQWRHKRADSAKHFPNAVAITWWTHNY
jgi:hypothetical protein